MSYALSLQVFGRSMPVARPHAGAQAALWLTLACGLALARCGLAGEISFEQGDEQVAIRIDGRPVASYVFRDAKILRPYFAHVRTTDGVPVTRNHPPHDDEPADHDTMHPGIWLAFGDLSGHDFWRNKAQVRHAGFAESPRGDGTTGGFVADNEYLAEGRLICRQRCRVEIRAGRTGWLLVLDSTFDGDEPFYFGDQEEMGLGVRVATPLAVKQGGRLTNSEGRSGEKQVWGRQADWCDYSGQVEGRGAGVLLAPDPVNFGRAWFHARDYGFVAANPFGRRAFGSGPASRVEVQPGQPLRLRFAVVIHSGGGDRQALYAEALEAMPGR